jgi:hypothetical protein
MVLSSALLRLRLGSFFLATVLPGSLLLGAVGALGQAAPTPGGRALPLTFEQNAGQLPAGDAFAGRAQNYLLEVRPDELRFQMAGEGRTISLSFAGTEGGRPAGVTEAGFRTNFYLGSDPKSWRTGVRNYDRVALKGLYPGIDAAFYARDGRIEHDFVVAPGADASQVAMRIAGAAKMSVTAAGDVDLAAAAGYLRLHKPVAYQVMADGQRRLVEARFELKAKGRTADKRAGEVAELRFRLGEYDHARELVIDPVIVYATYVAGNAGSVPAAVVSDASGNVYLTGYTGSTKTSFGAVSAGGTADPTGSLSVGFVAKLASSASGSQIAWLTYYGSTSGSTFPSAIALQPSGSLVYLGGSVTAANLPTGGGTFDTAPPAGASQYGFVASFATGTGTFAKGTYIEGGQTTTAGPSVVTALAATASGVTIAGETTGNLFPTTTSPLINSGDPSLSNPNTTKGVVVVLDPTLTTEEYGTYVCSDTCLTYSIYLTGVAVDSSGNIDIAGFTNGDFPQAGQYTSSSGHLTQQPNMWFPPSGKSGEDSFVAQIAPSLQRVQISLWTDGTANDTITSLVLDSSGNLIFGGFTSSTNLVSNASATTSYTLSSTSPSTPLDSVYPGSGSPAGFAGKLDSTGHLLALTYLGGTGSSGPVSTVSAVAADSVGNVYITGTTDSPKANFPQKTSGSSTASLTAVATLPSAEDLSLDTTSSSVNQRVFLLEMPSSLSSVAYRAYFGPSNGYSSGVGVAVDALAPSNAYVLLYGSASSVATGSFTTASAAQQAPQSTNGVSAYLAKVAFAAPGTSALSAGTQTCTIGGKACSSTNTAAYVSSTVYTPVTLTFQVTSSGTGAASSVVFNLPYSANLQAYSAAPTVTVGGTAVSGACTLGATTAANTKPGLTCVIPSIASGATAQVVLSTAVSSTAAASFTVSAAAFDAQGDSLTVTSPTVYTSGVPTLTLTDSASPTTVNAAQSVTDTVTPNTQVTYTFTIKNTSAYDSPSTTLSTALAVLSQTFTVTSTSSSTGCDPTSASCDVAAGGTLVYTVKGVYLAGQFASSGAGPFISASTVLPAATFAVPVLTTAPVSTGTATSVTIDLYKSAQTITFTQPSSPVTYGTSPIALSATATSGLAVTFSAISGPGSVSGSTLTITGAGTVVVAADQAGNNAYLAATEVQRTIVVNKAAVTVTGSALSLNYGQSGSMPITFTGAGAAVPSTGATYAIVNSSSVTVASGSLTLTAGASSAAGSVPVPATLAGGSYTVSVTYNGDANYLASSTSPSIALTVNPIAQTINFTAPASPVTFGVSPIGLSATATSGLSVTFSVVSGPGSVSGSTLTVTGAGTIVVAANQAGNANYSAASQVTRTIVVNPESQTISFTAPASPVTFGVAPIGLSATATSGLAVTFSVVSGPGSVSGSTLTVTGAGTIIVAANQAGNANYNAATQVTQTIVVNPEAQTISFAAPVSPVTFGVGPIGLTATATSGLAVTFSVVSGPGSISGSTLTVTGAGTIVVAANQSGSANYAAASQVTQTVVVNPAAQTISFTAPASPVSFGVGSIGLTATATSGLAVTFSVVSGPATVSGSTLTVTGVGTIVVAANQAGNANYTAASQVTQTVVVNPAAQTISFTAPASPVSYGAAPIGLTATATSGLAVTFSVVSGPGTVSGSTLTVTGVGTIVVAANQAGNANYAAASQVTQTVVVNKAIPAVTLTLSAPSVFLQSSVTFTASVPTAATGTVSFVNGTSPLGSGAVVNGVATLKTSTLTTGTYSVAAIYSGDGNFATATSAPQTETIQDFALGIASNSNASQTAARAATAIYILTVSPTGTSSPAAIALSISGLPAGATAAFAPSSVAAGSTASNVTLTIPIPANLAQMEPFGAGKLGRTLAPLGLALLLVPFAFRRKSKSFGKLRASLALVGLLAIASAAIAGCGGGTTQAPAENYTLTVTGTSGSLSHTTTLTLNVP